MIECSWVESWLCTNENQPKPLWTLRCLTNTGQVYRPNSLHWWQQWDKSNASIGKEIGYKDQAAAILGDKQCFVVFKLSGTSLSQLSLREFRWVVLWYFYIAKSFQYFCVVSSTIMVTEGKTAGPSQSSSGATASVLSLVVQGKLRFKANTPWKICATGADWVAQGRVPCEALGMGQKGARSC